MDIDRPDPPRNPSDDSDARRRHLGDWVIRGFQNLKQKSSLRENRREACHYRVVIEHALDSIRLTINHLKGSEWDVAEDCRRYAVLAINSELDYIIS
ncbi:hypothetical protein MJO29_005222, partial [Puccinia striiformis f. sp. tritici]